MKSNRFIIPILNISDEFKFNKKPLKKVGKKKNG